MTITKTDDRIISAASTTVIYLWRGERHRSATFATRSEALTALREFRNDGWQAWIE